MAMSESHKEPFMTSTSSISTCSSEIPTCVQAVILGEPNEPQPRCTGCRTNDKVFRCARCQVAHYCSQECQKKHFSFHKKLCKQVSSLRSTAEQYWDHHHDHVTDSTNPPIDILSDLITTLIIMGYRETDTVENGKFYYRKALQYCVTLARLCNNDSCHDDMVLLLLGFLGATPSTIRTWCTHTQSCRKQYFTTEQVDLDVDVSSNVFTTPQGLNSDDFTFHMLGLLVLMRVLVSQRQPTKEQSPSPNSLDTNMTVTQQIELLIASLKSHHHLQALIHLRDTIPFSPVHAPKLASPDKVPEEIWYLYQDCFFMTPGVNDILHEFIPEDDDPIDSD